MASVYKEMDKARRAITLHCILAAVIGETEVQ